MQGRASGAVRSFCMYGETTGEIDEFGLPVRYDWAADYKGRPRSFTATRRCSRRTGSTARSASTPAACFGGKLTALALSRDGPGLGAGRAHLLRADPAAGGAVRGDRRGAARQLDIADVLGKQVIDTRDLRHRHRARGQCRRRAGGDEPLRGRSALADPSAADHVAGRRPARRRAGSSGRRKRSPITAARASTHVVVEEKHMGSRALIVLARNQDVAEQPLRRGRRWPRRDRHPHRPSLLQRRRRSRRPRCTASTRRWRRPGCGTNSRRTGCFGMPRSCRGA